MAIGFRTAGTVANSTTEPFTVTLPAGFSPGEMHVLLVGTKAATPPTVNTPTGFTAPALNSWTGGAGAAGIDTGPNLVALFWRIAQAGDGNISVDCSAAGSPMQGVVLGFTKGADESWAEIVCAGGGDTTGSTTLYDPPAAANTIALRDGDWLGVADNINGDAGTPTLPGTLTVSGVTLNALVNRLNAGTNTGNDGRLICDTAPFSSGVAGAGPDRSITYSGANASMAGCSVFFRLQVAGSGMWSRLIHPGRGPFLAQSKFRRTPLDTTVAAAGAVEHTVDQTDDVGLTDTVQIRLELVREDQVGLTDSSTQELVKLLEQADPVGLTDSVALSFQWERVDQTGLTDTATIASTHDRSQTDQTGLTDSTTQQLIKLVEQTDQIGLTDSLLLQVEQVYTDLVGLTDTPTTQLVKALDQTDNLGLTDSASLVASYIRDLEDLLGLTDTVDVDFSGAAPPTLVYSGLDGGLTTVGGFDGGTYGAGLETSTTTASGLQ